MYTPQLVSVSTNFLAVEGNIISGDSTIITLSRTTSLTDAIQNKVELKAIVSIESDQGTLYSLTEKGKGIYVRGVTTLDPVRKYRLNIKTSDAKVYQSDFVPIKVTPPIDSIYLTKTNDSEVTLYTETDDPSNNTRYYKWDYVETWKQVPIYNVRYKYKNGVISDILPDSPEDISSCYRTTNSTEIIIGSSAKLAQDVIKQQRLGSIAASSQKISFTYVMQLRQYALTKEAFEYYQNLRANTEQLGTIFDPQPSLLLGNIHCITKPTDIVIGYISATTIAKKQFNMIPNDHGLRVPALNLDVSGVNVFSYPRPDYRYDCSVPPYNDDPTITSVRSPWIIQGGGQITYTPLGSLKTRMDKAWTSGDSLLFDIERDLSGNVIYEYAPKQCVDCRLKGGTNIKPAYYPN